MKHRRICQVEHTFPFRTRVGRIRKRDNPNDSPVNVKRTAKPRALGNCYWNVAQVVEESGGEVVLGWAFLMWPKYYFEAMHHAVWRNRDGRLIELTEKYPTDPVHGHTVFLPDASIDVSFDRLPHIPLGTRSLMSGQRWSLPFNCTGNSTPSIRSSRS